MNRDKVGSGRWGRSGAGRIAGFRSRPAGRHRLRPVVLQLEGRRLLATFTVTSTADNGAAGTLRYEIQEANATSGANTIDFDPTVFSTPKQITLAGSQLDLTNTSGPQTITGPAASVTISAGGQSRDLQIDPGVNASISDLTLTGGTLSGNGGGLNNSGSLILTDCTISGDNANSGRGGGLYSTGTVSLTGCTISGDNAELGGGLNNHKGTMTLTDCTVSGNGTGNLSGGTAGGGFYNTGALNLTNCTVTGNTGYTGGGLNNVAGSTADLTDCRLDANSAKYNGGMLNAGTANLVDCTVGNNVAWLDDGGLDNTGTVDLTNCLVSGNQAGIACGGLSNIGKANLTYCAISGNVCGTGGGGLSNGESEFGSPGELVLTDCTISGNSTAHSGGGVFDDGVVTTLTACTIGGNSAANSGGGLYNSAPITLTACTITGNSCKSGGGLFNANSATLTDTIVAGNTLPNSLIPSDIGGNNVASSSSYNLIGPGGAGGLKTGVNGNIVMGDTTRLGLAPLGFYGGPTQTMALLPGSEAIGNGTAVNGLTTDQRGEPLDSPTPDIGAFQTQATLVVNNPGDGTTSSWGALNLRQAVNLANIAAAAQTITFDPADFDTPQTIALTQGPLVLGDTGRPVTITGPKGALTVSGGGASGVWVVASGVTAAISGLTITGGSAGSGGGLDNRGTTTLTDCTLFGNSASGDGGGLYDEATATLTLTDCTIGGNSAKDGGGLAIGGTASLTDCTIGGNFAGGSGGGLYNQGVATLQDTIVAGNTGSGGSASDIAGSVAGSSSYNLIGNGGSGGLTNGPGHNIVLTNLAGLGLAPLGDFGGPTETMAILPGSAAIGKGTAVSGITADQRGASRSTSGGVDIGAFQDQGYTVAAYSGGAQIAMVGQPFSSPIVAELTEDFAGARLPGATIHFGAPSSGASATLSAASAVTDATGQASITATANATAGRYSVTASATGVTSSASFNLANQIQPNFSGLTDLTVTYGSTVTVMGTLAAGQQVPVGEEVAVTVLGVTQDPTIGSDGSFSVQFSRADVVLNAQSGAYYVTYAYTSDGVFLAASGSSQLTVNPEPLTITAATNSKVYDGTTIAAALPTITSGTLVTGDSASFSETYGTAEVGTGLPLTPSGLVDDDNGGKNYSYTFVPVSTGVITPAPLTVTAETASKTYGQALNFAGTEFTTAGLIDGDAVSRVSLTSPGAAATAGVSGSPYAITASDASGTGLSNYEITYMPGTLTVNKAPLTITAGDSTKVYGAALPAFTVSYSGFVNGDTAASLTMPPKLTTTATASSPVQPGGYAITASGTVDPNYTITYCARHVDGHPRNADAVGVGARRHLRRQPVRGHGHDRRHGRPEHARRQPGGRHPCRDLLRRLGHLRYEPGLDAAGPAGDLHGRRLLPRQHRLHHRTAGVGDVRHRQVRRPCRAEPLERLGGLRAGGHARRQGRRRGSGGLGHVL